jgi:2-enoate reductase
MNVGGNNESDGCLSKRGIDYFVERAKGGTGMIITGAVRVTRDFERDQKTIPLWMLFADHMIHAKWISELSERCHDYGTKVCLQLTPGGGASSWCICSAA